MLKIPLISCVDNSTGNEGERVEEWLKKTLVVLRKWQFDPEIICTPQNEFLL